MRDAAARILVAVCWRAAVHSSALVGVGDHLLLAKPVTDTANIQVQRCLALVGYLHGVDGFGFAAIFESVLLRFVLVSSVCIGSLRQGALSLFFMLLGGCGSVVGVFFCERAWMDARGS